MSTSRYLTIDADYRLEIRRERAEPEVNHRAVTVAIDLVGQTDDGAWQSVDAEELFEVAMELCGYQGEDEADALDALLGYGIESAEAYRIAALDRLDPDAPIAYEVIDPPAPDVGQDADWEGCFGADPDAPESYRLTEDDLDEMARAEELRCGTPTGRLLVALDRAGGGL